MSTYRVSQLAERVWETGARVQVKTDLRPRIETRLAEAEQRRQEVDGFIASLRAALAHLDALPDRSSRCDPNCGFLTLASDDGASP